MQLQNVSELQVRVGTARVVGDRPPVGGLTGFDPARLLQSMTVLDPDRRVARIAVERLAIELRRDVPLAHLPRPVGAGDYRLFRAP